MNPNIPMGWKLLGVKAENVTRLNLLEVAENVKNWIEGSVSREAALTANSQKVSKGVPLPGQFKDFKIILQNHFSSNFRSFN